MDGNGDGDGRRTMLRTRAQGQEVREDQDWQRTDEKAQESPQEL